MTPRIKNCSFQNYGVYTSRSYRKNFKSKTRWVSVRLGQTEQCVSGVFSILFFFIFCINLELSGWGVPAACPWLAQLPGNSGSMVARSHHAVTVYFQRRQWGITGRWTDRGCLPGHWWNTCKWNDSWWSPEQEHRSRASGLRPYREHLLPPPEPDSLQRGNWRSS